ncbi:PorV/PorQ family protein [Pedobacter psychrodurus]|uniref:PorV/PorQ family protein n=1 Tax=Pedobacter psychrodurus TaxID=2530456 RepID=A0A4R0PG02_9SPHI|nr:PorV/PorQ family protein [Pedobacter psychrodurus]TCD16853.1 PorV/PorQ family protein [Pedobacter psychrodurus]
MLDPGTVNGNRGSGKAVAVDVSAFHRSDITFAGTAAVLSLGLNLSNMGTKMTYRNTGQSYFLPANMKLGSALKIGEGQNKLTLLLDFNKLMVPTQPVYDSNGNIVKGRDPDRSVPSGIFGSFTDAPGGFREELKEVGISTGAEMSFREILYLRAGYLYQHPEKANTSYLTLGLGIHYSSLSLDFSYLVGSGYNPLRNTLRFGIQTKFSRSK